MFRSFSRFFSKKSEPQVSAQENADKSIHNIDLDDTKGSLHPTLHRNGLVNLVRKTTARSFDSTDSLDYVLLIPDAACIVNSLGLILKANSKFHQSLALGMASAEHGSVANIISTGDREKFAIILKKTGNSTTLLFTSISCKVCLFAASGQLCEDDCEIIVSGDGHADSMLITFRLNDRSLPKAVGLAPQSRLSLHSRSIVAGQQSGSLETIEESIGAAVRHKPRATRHQDLSSKLFRSQSDVILNYTPMIPLEQQQNKREAHFISNMSHLIRSPMNAALSALVIAENEVKKNSANVLDTLRDVRFSCENAMSVLNDYHIYARLKGDIDLHHHVCSYSILKILMELTEQFKPQADYCNIKLRLDIALGSADDAFVEVDVDGLTQIFRNLLMDAMKYTPDHGSVMVRVAHAERQGYVRVEFCDTGRGIPSSEEKKLFQETDEGASQGTGIGPYISRRLVEHFKGTIGARPGSASGSVFFLELPISGGTPSKRKLRSDSTVSKTESKPKLLIVDDDALCRKMHRRLFAPFTETCIEVCNGQDAISIVKLSMAINEPFDCILMDFSMPIMNGPTATKLLRQAGFQGKIIGVTGNSLQSDLDDFRAHGASTVFIKPLSSSKIGKIVDELTS